MVSIIGGGAIGNYVAYLLAKNGEKVNLYEEHREIGKPIQCTGIVSESFKDVIKVEDSFLVNRFEFININLGDKNLRIKSTNFLLDRRKFDKYMFELARSEDVKVFLNHKFMDLKNDKIKVNNQLIKFDKLIGADGPYSKVAKLSGLFGKREFEYGIQARVKGNFDDEVDVFLDKGKFGWIVPEDNKIARIGVFGNIKDFKDLVKNRKIIEYQSGIVPIYNYKLKSVKDNIFLVGDAATQVKATTYGGLVPGIMAAKELNKAILNREDYHKLWKKKIGKELFFSLLIRKKLDKLNYEDKEKLINLFRGNIKNLIEKYSRDYPSKFVFGLLLKEPRLIKFLFK